MNGIFNKKQSWEKQSVYDLENGWRATLGYGHYGESITRLDSPDRKFYWHHSNGIKDLPDFARAWLRGGVVPERGPDHTTTVDVKFTKIFR